MEPSPQRKRQGSLMRQMALAMELPFIILGGVLVGGGVGYLLDRWLHTKPYLMLVFGALGFGAGVFDLLRRLRMYDSEDSGGSKR